MKIPFSCLALGKKRLSSQRNKFDKKKGPTPFDCKGKSALAGALAKNQ